MISLFLSISSNCGEAFKRSHFVTQRTIWTP